MGKGSCTNKVEEACCIPVRCSCCPIDYDCIIPQHPLLKGYGNLFADIEQQKELVDYFSKQVEHLMKTKCRSPSEECELKKMKFNLQLEFEKLQALKNRIMEMNICDSDHNRAYVKPRFEDDCEEECPNQFEKEIEKQKKLCKMTKLCNVIMYESIQAQPACVMRDLCEMKKKRKEKLRKACDRPFKREYRESKFFSYQCQYLWPKLQAMQEELKEVRNAAYRLQAQKFYCTCPCPPPPKEIDPCECRPDNIDMICKCIEEPEEPPAAPKYICVVPGKKNKDKDKPKKK